MCSLPTLFSFQYWKRLMHNLKLCLKMQTFFVFLLWHWHNTLHDEVWLWIADTKKGGKNEKNACTKDPSHRKTAFVSKTLESKDLVQVKLSRSTHRWLWLRLRVQKPCFFNSPSCGIRCTHGVENKEYFWAILMRIRYFCTMFRLHESLV